MSTHRAVLIFAAIVSAIFGGVVHASGDPGPFQIDFVQDPYIVVGWDRAELEAVAAGDSLNVAIPLRADLDVDVELKRFHVTTSQTRFVLGRKNGPDIPLDFDARKVVLFRGTVRGRPGSHAFIALYDGRVTGSIDLGPAGGLYRISTRNGESELLEPQQASVFAATRAPMRSPEVPFCGLRDLEPGSGGTNISVPHGATSIAGLRQLELAVDTDHEFFELFGDATTAASYLVSLYGAISDIFIRDVGVRIDLVFVRVWDDEDDIVNGSGPTTEFRAFWEDNMAGVSRDAAQMLSGRRDYPFGGQAYLNGLCGDTGYSVTGYALGTFPDPSRPSPYHYDIEVAAHELGHNFGAPHTHSNGIDTCNDPNTIPRRGPIMSYCGQTWSGGNANHDLYFHSVTRQDMSSFVDSAACLAADCNANSTLDTEDISGGMSLDSNANGVPDECEDCDNNGTLDPQDLATGGADIDGNGVLDSCEPDCNNNGTPDAKDIFDSTSVDLYGNGIPDECEADCNFNGISDYTEIQADMSRDIDRDAILDSCQDCDGDTVTDLSSLARAHGIWIASGLPGSDVAQFHGTTGVRESSSAGALIQSGQDLLVAPDGRLLVSSADDSRIMEFDSAGTYLGDLVPSLAHGLKYPTGMAFGPLGDLYVSSRNSHRVIRFDASDGSFIADFVVPGLGGLIEPYGLTFGPAGNLFVTSSSNEIIEYDGASGSLVRIMVPAADNGGLDSPRGLTFKPDGNLLVASYGTDQVLEYNGKTGEPLGPWAKSGTETVLTQESPWGIRVGPNGNIFVARTGPGNGPGGGAAVNEDLKHVHSDDIVHDDHQDLHLTNAQLYEFDARNGNFVRTVIGGVDHGLLFPTGFAFVPGWSIDCNLNWVQDSCDISSGSSQDADVSGVPDECESDCNANGTLDRLDVIPFGSAQDCNANLSPDSCDISDALSQDCSGNGIPDECEADCNGNLRADSCDILDRGSLDCNHDSVPDECNVVDDLESPSTWTVGAAGDGASQGVWELVNPVGSEAQPENDHTRYSGRLCFVTGQGAPGDAADVHDVDGGKTTLMSPLFDLSNELDPALGYWRWYSNDTGANPAEDVLLVEITNDGGATWKHVETVGPASPETSGGWFPHVFRVLDFVQPTSQVMLRFIADDAAGPSTVEAAIDDLVMTPWSYETPQEVVGVVVDDNDPIVLRWDPQGGSIVYDVVGGMISTLRELGSTGDASCLDNDLEVPQWVGSQAAPENGDGFYFLVRAQQGCAAGTYGRTSSDEERQVNVDCP